MLAIANLTINEFRRLVGRFDQKYVNHWNAWIQACQAQENISREFGRILRSWQAFRPNIMRRPQAEANHEPPYLEDIISETAQYINDLEGFDISVANPLSDHARNVLTQLWKMIITFAPKPDYNAVKSLFGKELRQ